MPENNGERPPDHLITRGKSPERPQIEHPRPNPVENRVDETPRQAEALSEQLQTIPYKTDVERPLVLYGDFASNKAQSGGIVLSPEIRRAVESSATIFRAEAKFMTNTITGEQIAAEYDIRTRNFSTQTRIAELPDGRKVFIVYDHKGSSVHRVLDRFMKWASGLRMKKVSRKEWKKQFEGKSTIPVIENTDADTIVMPFIPNVNGFDLFAQNGEIENFGVCEWAKEAGLEEKLQLAEAIVDEVARVHASGTAWGELILPNIIFSKEKRPIICDPEVRYNDDVSLPEAKARDLRDLLVSVSGALSRAHDLQDPTSVVKKILDRYPDSTVIVELQKLAAKERTFLQNLTFGYEQVRSGTPSKAAYDQVLKVVREYQRD